MNTIFNRWTLTAFGVLALAVSVRAAEVPESTRAAIEQVRTSGDFQPAAAFRHLNEAVPRLSGDAPGRAAVAAALREAAGAADTTPLGRSVLCRHLAVVAGEADMEVLRAWLSDPDKADAARLALDAIASPAATPPDRAALLADAASDRPATRIAALSSLVHHHARAAVPVLTSALGDADPDVRATAIALLARVDGAALAAALPRLDPPHQTLALDALALHRVRTARAAVRALLDDADEHVRSAAREALGAVGDAGDLPLLAERGAHQAISRLTAPGVDDAIRKGIESDPDPARRLTLVQAAAARGADDLVPTLLRAARDVDEGVETAALRALSRMVTPDAYAGLIDALAETGSPDIERIVTVMGRRLSDPAARDAPLRARLQDDAVSPEAQKALWRTLAAFGGDETLALLRQTIASSASAPDARNAAIQALAEWQDDSAMEDLAAVVADAASTEDQRALARGALERLLPAAPDGIRARVYLNCGVNERALGRTGERLRLLQGTPWTWAPQAQATVAFDAKEVVIEASHLNEGQAYWLGFSWWDYDGRGRAQTVTINGRPVSPKIRLPTWTDAQQPAEALTVNIPADEIKDGRVRIGFRMDESANAVVSEVWLAEGSDSTAGIRVIEVEAAVPRAEVRANEGAEKRVLIVTGLEYPGHPWRETTPLLVKGLAADPRMEISVSEEPAILAHAALGDYDAIVLHYQNHEIPPPEGALANLSRIVKEGRGLVIVHFASGAFIDWTTRVVPEEFEVLAGRIWNTQRRGHDPHGVFRVRITDAEHPITAGLEDFDTLDELYTMLDGDTPIRVLAEATSRVDGESYPIVFVTEPGKGRSFHCALGHDPRAFNEPTLQLYRRGVAWAAGLPLD